LYVTLTFGICCGDSVVNTSGTIDSLVGYMFNTFTSSSVALLLKSVRPIVSKCVVPGFF